MKEKSYEEDRRLRECAHAIPRPLANAHASKVLVALLYIGAPLILRQLCALILYHPSISITPTLDMVEYFAGCHEVSQGQWQIGHTSVPYEVLHDSVAYNLLGDEGFLHGLKLALSCRSGACGWLAPVCSSWIFLNRFTSGRTATRPLGNFKERQYVADANVMVSRCVLLAWVFVGVGGWFAVEQPANSLLAFHPRMQQLMKVVKVLVSKKQQQQKQHQRQQLQQLRLLMVQQQRWQQQQLRRQRLQQQQ